MSAELLREAAGLIRERAEVATPGPWRHTDSETVNDVWEGGLCVVSSDSDPIANVQDEWYEADEGEPTPFHDATHIASWHPAVALAVADWLDGVALFVEAKDDEEYFDLDGDPIAAEDTHAIGSALDVARAYLGRDA